MMIFTSIYGVVDGFFVSNFAGKTAFAAINLIMPVLILLGTVGFVFGTGGTALVSKTYGMGEREKANRYFSLLVYVTLAMSIVLMLLGLALIRPVAISMKATDALLENSVLYAKIILFALPFYVLQVMFQSFFVAAEKPHLGLGVCIAAGLTNMVLDAILVMLLPQEYKLAGAAIATAAGQMVGGVIPLVYFSCKNSSLLRLGKTKFDGRAVLKACTNGSSEFMSNVAMSVVGILYNLQLMQYAGENGVAAYGMMMYVSMIFSAIFFGYSIGITPVFGYHYGAQNHRELKSLLQKSLHITASTGVVMVLLAELSTVPLAQFFVGYDRELYDLTVHGFRIFSFSFGFMGIGIFTSAFFTALNDGLRSATVSFLRTLLFQCAAIIVLPRLFNIDGVWSSVVAAEFLALALSAAFLTGSRKRYGY